MFGSVTPSSLTRRSIVVRACTTACSRMVRSMFGFSLNSYAPADAGAAIVVGHGLFVGDAPELRVPILRDAFDLEHLRRRRR